MFYEHSDAFWPLHGFICWMTSEAQRPPFVIKMIADVFATSHQQPECWLFSDWRISLWHMNHIMRYTYCITAIKLGGFFVTDGFVFHNDNALWSAGKMITVYRLHWKQKIVNLTILLSLVAPYVTTGLSNWRALVFSIHWCDKATDQISNPKRLLSLMTLNFIPHKCPLVKGIHGHWWIPHTKDKYNGAVIVFVCFCWREKWTNGGDVDNFTCHGAHTLP